MMGPDPKGSAGLSDLETPIPMGPEYGEAMAGEHAAHQDFHEREAHEQTVENLRLLWANHRFLGRVTGAGLLLTTLIALLIPNRYQSVARLMPPDSQSGSGGLAMAAAALTGGAGTGGLGGMAGDLLGLKNTSDLLVGVLNSRTVKDKVIQKLDLRKVYGVRRMEDAREHLTSRTDILVDRKSQIITIDVTDRSPRRAAAIAQVYVEELNRTVAEVSMSSARRERIFLEGRLQAVNEDLEAAEREFSQFASKNSAIDIHEQGKAMVDAAATLQGELIAARSELEGLRQLYADSNVRVRSVQARVAELENQLKKVGGKDDSTSFGKATQSDSLYPSIRKLPLLGVPYADLYRKVKVQEAVLETLTQQYELAKMQEAKEIPTVKVLDPPNLPEKKSFPPRRLFILLGTMLALSCGVTWVLGRKVWDQSDPTSPGKLLAQEVFDTVKAAMTRASRNGSRVRALSRNSGGLAGPPDVEKEVGK
jgi:uncharacterized protein involved in exopolysaccharide biosynthesis